jgi:hypothetical protein
VSVDYIKAEHSIISIIEFQGIRFTSRNFQIELLLRQVLVVPDIPLFETCVIKESLPRPEPVPVPVPEPGPEPGPEPVQEPGPEPEPGPTTPEYLGTDQDQDQDQDPSVSERETLKHFEFTEVDIDFKNIPDTIDTREPEFQMVPEITNPETATVNTIKLKKHKDVLYEMYKVAKHKAQEAKKAAIRAYLEAKEIKAAYLLDDSDSSDNNNDDDDSDE